MTKSDKKIEEKPSSEDKNNNQKVEAEENKNISEEETIENKLKVVEEKLLRTAAEMENQRKRFEKERHDAFEFGGFNFARESLSLLDNIDRDVTSFKNDENLKKNKDLNKVIEGVEIVKNDLVSIFKKNGIELIECINKKFNPNFHQEMLDAEVRNRFWYGIQAFSILP